MPDGEEKVAEAVRKVFSVADIPTLGNTVRKRWVTVEEWGDKSVCMWGTTLGDRVRIEGDVALAAGNQQQGNLRRQIATVIECARTGEEENATRVFERTKHWAWLETQPGSVLDPLLATVADLDASGTVTGAIAEAFGIPELERRVSSLERCLSYTASASGSCTDCPQNSLPGCPLHNSTLPSPPTES